jgi:MFS family permease
MFSLTRSGVAVGFLFFTLRSCTATIEEYMPLFMAQLGYSTLYIGIVPLFGFITRLIVVPLGSYVSDKFQIRRLMLFLCIVISIPTILLFLAPKGPDVPCKMSPLANSSIGINNTTKSSPMSSMFHDAVFHKA